MRIAIFTDLYLDVAGGIPASIQAQKEALKKAGHEVLLFCPGKHSDDQDVVLVPTRFFRIEHAPIAKAPRKIENFILEQFSDFAKEFDVVHVHYEAACSIAGVRLAQKFALPIVQTMHGREDMAVAVNVAYPFKTAVATLLNYWHAKNLGFQEPIKKDQELAPTLARARMWTLMARQANAANLVTVPSQHFADKLKKYGVKREIKVVSNGVDDNLVLAKNWRHREFKAGETLKIVWANRVSKEKRFLVFLEALNLIKDLDFEFLVIGDGNEMAKAKKFVKKQGLGKKVIFKGAIPHTEVLECFANQHVSVINSYGFDTQGLTILEAAACGLPVIYADPDMNKIVPANGGLQAKDNSPAAMATLIEGIFRQPDLIEKMSQAMMEQRKEVLQSTQIKKLLKIYENLIKS